MRTRSGIGLCLVAAWLFQAQPAFADESVVGTGTITRVSAVLLSQSVDEDGNTVLHRLITLVIDGFLVGTIAEDDTRVITPNGEISQTGTATCACTVADRSGTVVWSYQATVVPIAPGVLRFAGEFEILTGTAGLATLRGEATWIAEGSVGTTVAAYAGEFSL